MAKYKCPTLGDCDKANSGEIFERAPGEELKTRLAAPCWIRWQHRAAVAVVAVVAARTLLIAAGAAWC